MSQSFFYIMFKINIMFGFCRASDTSTDYSCNWCVCVERALCLEKTNKYAEPVETFTLIVNGLRFQISGTEQKLVSGWILNVHDLFLAC